MTEEQFNALRSMINAMIDGLFFPQDIQFKHVQAATDKARALLVEQPAKCVHIVDDSKRPWVCIVCGEPI